MKSLRNFIIQERGAAPKVDLSKRKKQEGYGVMVDGIMDMFFNDEKEAQEHADMLKKKGGDGLKIEVQKITSLVNERYVGNKKEDTKQNDDDELRRRIKLAIESLKWDRKFSEYKKYVESEEKMKLWHEGKRGFNAKTASADKLRRNWLICKDKNYIEVLEIEKVCKQKGISLELDQYGKFI